MPFDGKPDAFRLPLDARRERLMQLCRVLAEIDDKAFDLRDWSKNGRCDSVACAVGWAIRDTWFKSQGLTHDDRTPAYGPFRSWQAVRAFFGLSREEAFDLFHVGRYDMASRQAVLARVRGLAEQI